MRCPGRATSRNSYLGIGRETPPAGRLSCGNEPRGKSGSSGDHGGLGLGSPLCHRKQDPSFYTLQADTPYSFMSRLPGAYHALLKRDRLRICLLCASMTVNSVRVSMVSYLFRNVRCPALGLANRKSSVRRAQYRLQSDLGAFAPAAPGKFCPVSSHCWLAIVTQAPFQVSFHQRGLLWSPHLKRPPLRLCPIPVLFRYLPII